MPRISRRTFVAATLASVGSSQLARAQGTGGDRVTLGIVNTISDAPFFIAQAKGYFRDMGLDVDIADFPSGAKMIASLGTGQLDVSGGAVSAGLYNAAERGIPVRIVADKARNAPKYGFESILVRQDLMDSGRFADFKDLKGLKVAIPAIGSAGEQSILNEAMKRGGLAFTECERVYLSTGDQFAGLQNKAIDVAIHEGLHTWCTRHERCSEGWPFRGFAWGRGHRNHCEVLTREGYRVAQGDGAQCLRSQWQAKPLQSGKRPRVCSGIGACRPKHQGGADRRFVLRRSGACRSRALQARRVNMSRRATSCDFLRGPQGVLGRAGEA
jgi:hypothetical protein